MCIRDRPDTTAVRKLLSSADAVLVSEPSALSDTPDAQSLLAVSYTHLDVYKRQALFIFMANHPT